MNSNKNFYIYNIMKHHNIRAALIPHAGKDYAGQARFNAFKYINPNTKYIIYISAFHKLNHSNKSYIFHNDNIISNVDISDTQLNLEIATFKEDSFEWVYPELKFYFPRAKILAIGPKFYKNGLINYIYNFLINHDKSVLIATSDLIHYGSNYNNIHLLKKPQQIDKIHKEEFLISHLVSSQINITKIRKHTYLKHLMCGPRAIEFFSEIMIKLNYHGKVVDYYDSYSMGKSRDKDILNKYLISAKKRDNFVSYVSIIYGAEIIQDIILDFDIIMQIAILKSTIKNNLDKIEHPLLTPIWSPFHRTKQGVFLGTNIDRQTNCSTGVFESDELVSTAVKIVRASKNCISDAADRWHIPYKKDMLDRMKYKIELLKPRNEWKKYPASAAHKVFDLKSGKYGVLLTLRSGKSATYLPIVAQENPNWSIDKYMESLSKKAIGDSNNKEWMNWKKGKIEIYKTTTFIWDSNKQKLLLQ